MPQTEKEYEPFLIFISRLFAKIAGLHLAVPALRLFALQL